MSDSSPARGPDSISRLAESLQSVYGYSSQIHEIAANLGGNANTAFETAQSLQKKVETMAASVNTTHRETQELLEESKKIKNVLALMRDIVEATHVLGINASITAARAGTAGNPFRVVSGEIRKLAESSAKSLENIESIVRGLQEKIKLVSSRIDDSSSSIMGQIDSLLAVAGSLQGTVLSVDVIHTVSAKACSETSTGIDTVRRILLDTK